MFIKVAHPRGEALHLTHFLFGNLLASALQKWILLLCVRFFLFWSVADIIWALERRRTAVRTRNSSDVMYLRSVASSFMAYYEYSLAEVSWDWALWCCRRMFLQAWPQRLQMSDEITARKKKKKSKKPPRRRHHVEVKTADGNERAVTRRESGD